MVAPPARQSLNLTWVGDGAANNWDSTSTNWINGGTKYAYQAGDGALFTDSGSANPPVNLQAGVFPLSLVVNNKNRNYIFTGSGGIVGTLGLTKTNSGALTILNTNSYTGPTVIGGGVLELETGALLSSGTASPIGAASSDPSNLVFYGSTFRYSGIDPSNGMDRGMTTVSGVTLDVTNAGTAFTEYGLVTGAGGLTKVGQGAFALQNVNTYTGGTVISNGILSMGFNNANWNGGTGSGVGPTNSPVTFMGTNGTLQLFGWLGYSNYAAAFNNFYNPLVIPAGQVGNLDLPGRGNPATGAGAGLNSSLTGSGTLNLVVNYVRYPLSGNWSGFSGQINVTGAGFPSLNANTAGAVTANIDEFRINNTYGYTNAAIYLYGSTAPGNQNTPQSTLVMCQTAGSGATIDIGELGGDYTSVIGTGTGSAGNTTWRVGWKNTTNTFYGVIANDSQTGVGVTSITKVGTGKWVLAGANTYSGSTTVSNGVLALIMNPNTYNDASIARSTNIFINTGAVLDLSGLANPMLALNAGQTLGGGGTLVGGLNASGVIINPGSAIATGALTINGSLTESGVTNYFQLSTNASPDVIQIQGSLDVSSGTQVIVLNEFGGGLMPNGTYPLFTYTGGLSGGTNNFSVVPGPGAFYFTGLLTNITTVTPNQIAFVVTSGRPATNLVWKGDSVSNHWDYVTTNDWVNGANYFQFLPGDRVAFNDSGAPNTNITLQAALGPAAVVVSNATQNFTFAGSGSISGATGLTKTNSGTLTLLTTNSYTGPTILGGGTLSIASVANSGVSSPIGAAGNDPTNLVFFGSTLKYTGASAATDHGATLNATGGIFDVIGGATLTLNGVITGPGALTLTDAGTLALAATNANTYSGGTLVNAGQLVFSTATAIPAAGTLTLNGAASVTVTPASPLPNVLVNGTNSITGNGNAGTGIASLDVEGRLTLLISGGSTVFDLTGPMTGPGNLILGTAAMTLRFNGTAGDGSAIFNLGTGTGVAFVRNTPAAIALGGLTGGSGTQLQGPNNVATNTIYTIGGANTNTVFSGVIKDGTAGNVSLVKTGTGTLTLSGANTYTGSTLVSNGTLQVSGAIANGAVTVAGGTLMVNGSIGYGGVAVNGGTLAGSGVIGGAVTVQAGGAIVPGAVAGAAGTVLTINNSLALNSGGAITLAVSHNNHTNDLISCVAIVYGGTLTVATNAGDAPFVAGDVFKLFNASFGIYASSFSATNLPALSPGLIWQNHLAVDGSITVMSASSAPVAGFSGSPTNLFVTQTVTFTDSSTGSITNWVWSFGDGNVVTNTSNASVPHTYAAAGSYTVGLTVNGAGGSSNSTLANYVVVKPRAALGGVTLTGREMVFSGASGPAGQPYRLLTAANVALPLTNWTPVWTNVFAPDGSYSCTNALGTNAAGFFLLVSP